MSSSELVISVKNLFKRFEIYDRPADRLKQFFLPKIQKLLGKIPTQYFREFRALNDISFDIKKGNTIGIIGRNGSGKSTLLQIICGTLSPTSGSVEVRGNIAALLELGSGFNPEFTGRENVYMNASVLGLSNNEINKCFQEIVDFSEIGEFIDQPVKTYSSGMYIRLAFSVIIHVNANILVVDEALAVGDMAFQLKCINKIKKMKSSGCTIILVSHDINQIQSICDTVIYLKKGMIYSYGNVGMVTSLYLSDIASKLNENENENISTFNSLQPTKFSYKDLVKIQNVDMLSDDKISNTFKFGKTIGIKVDCEITKSSRRKFYIVIYVVDKKGQLILRFTSFGRSCENRKFNLNKKNIRYIFEFENLLQKGTYYLKIHISEDCLEGGEEYIEYLDFAYMFDVLGCDENMWAIYNPHNKLKIDNV